MEYLQMDSNKIRELWLWLTESQTRLVGLILLILAFALFLALMVLISQKPINKKPQLYPATKTSQNNLPVRAPISTPVDTTNWHNLVNNNGFSFKYPKEATISGYLGTATSSAAVQVNMGESVLAVETFSKMSALSLEKIVELTRQKNASSSANQKILTRPISILFAGNRGYEWYLESSRFFGNYTNFTSRPGRNRVIQFEKGDKLYIIFTTFDDSGEQLLSTFRLNP